MPHQERVTAYYDVIIGRDCFNCTYNMSKFFRDHMPEGINGLHGMTGRQACEAISDCFSAIDSSYCRHGKQGLSEKYDAPNGWGSVIGALIFLGEIQGASAANPRKKVEVT